MRSFLFAVTVLAFGLFTFQVEAADKADKKKAAGKNVAGKITKVDAASGTITVAVKAKGEKEAKDTTFTITDDVKVMILDGEQKKEMVGKEGLKDAKFKEGEMVTIKTDEAGKVLGVQIGAGKKKEKK
jgi:hypothetical protein